MLIDSNRSLVKKTPEMLALTTAVPVKKDSGIFHERIRPAKMILFRNSAATTIFRYWLIGFLAIIAIPLSIRPAAAHPHVFIDTRLVVELDDEGIRGFRQYWAFDEYFSSWVIDEFDRDKDGTFSDEELAVVYEETFTYIKNYNYFTRILSGDREIAVTDIEDFHVIIEDGRAVYSFFVPLDIKTGRESREILIAVYDESFYCQIFFPPAEIEFKGNRSAWKITHTTPEIQEFSYYFGMLVPTVVKLSITPL